VGPAFALALGLAKTPVIGLRPVAMPICRIRGLNLHECADDFALQPQTISLSKLIANSASEGTQMNKFVAPLLAASLAVSATAAFAGGPVIIEDVEVVEEKPASSIGILPLLLIPIILCVALCGGDDDNNSEQ
jgi:hypothetical protein